MDQESKTCLRCQELLPIYSFAIINSGNRKPWRSSYCKPCKVGVDNEWKRLNGERHSDYYHEYVTDEYNFIRERINSKFKESQISQASKEMYYLKNDKYLPKVWVPELTKIEMWNELMLHIQHMKEEFPKSNGRLCKICFEPWTYTRSKPKPGSHGSRKISGGKAYRKRYPKNFSIDRFDTTQTYKKGNIIFVCGECNHAKGNSEAWLWSRCLEIKNELEKENQYLEIPKIWRDNE